MPFDSATCPAQPIISDDEAHRLIAELQKAILTALAWDESDGNIAQVGNHLAAALRSKSKLAALMLAAGYQMIH